MHPRAFDDPDFQRMEKVSVFERSWVCVGMASNLPKNGDSLVRTVGTQPIIIVRNKAGELRAFKNVCRHRAATLCTKDGHLPGNKIICKYHRWAYDLDGNLLATPLFMSDEGGRTNPKDAIEEKFDTGHMVDFDKKDFALFPVRVDTFRNMVFVNIDGSAPPLLEYLGDLPEQLKEYEVMDNHEEFVSVGSSSYQVEANWKLCIENFLEYYHLPSVHPELCKVSVVDNHMRTQGDGSYIGFVTRPLGEGGTPVDAMVLPPMPGLTGDNLKTAWYAVAFPNVFYFLYPHSCFTVVVMPDEKDPTKSVEYADLSVHKSCLEAPDAEAKLERMYEFYDMVNKEDIEVVERVQEGLQVYEYQGGRMAFRFEETIHRFQNMVADYMIGMRRIPFGDAKKRPGAAAFLGVGGKLSRELTF